MRLNIILRCNLDAGSGQSCPLRNQKLRLDDVDARHLFGNGVLDLYPGVDFDEKELVGVCIYEKLYGSGILVIHLATDGQGGFAQCLPNLVVECWCRRDLYDFLVSSLYGAITLEKMYEGSLLVAEQLHFDMPRSLDEFFDEDVRATERGERLASCLLVCRVKLFGTKNNPHAASTTAVGRF